MKLLEVIFIASICNFYSKNAYTEAQGVFSNIETKESFQHDGSFRYPNYTECGGVVDVLMDELVVIEYKLNGEYNNNEMCVWTLRSNDALEILLTKVTSGFEVGHDFLQVTYFSRYSHDTPRLNHLMGNSTGIEQIVVPYQGAAFLIFSTDGSTTGTGFRFEIAARGDIGYKYWKEDFFTALPTGSNSLRPYQRETMATWVIAPNDPEINMLELQVEYSTERILDEVTIFQIERNGGRMNFRFLDRLSGEGTESYTIQYFTTYVVLFVSDYGTVNDGEGITLSWIGRF